MTMIDLIELFLIGVTFLMWLITRIPPCPHNIRDLELSRQQLNQIWSHFYTYEVAARASKFYIRRNHKIDLISEDYSDSCLTKAEAEARLKYPDAIISWRNWNKY